MKLILSLLMTVLALSVWAEAKKPFPAHWGEPPDIQTRDYRPLPGGYGFGSSTLASWIEKNMAKDAATPGTTAGEIKPLYVCDFSDQPDGPLPDSFMVIQGEFEVKLAGTNKLVELPGAPLDSYSALFGPVSNANIAVEARIFATSKGRRMPTFGVGLGGVAGYKLRIAPAKEKAELLLDTQVIASVPFDWQSGEWTRCKLQIRQTGEGAWKVEAKAWAAGGVEPATWLLAHDASETPINGQASIMGSPFSGTPIQYDDLVVKPADKTVAGRD